MLRDSDETFALSHIYMGEKKWTKLLFLHNDILRPVRDALKSLLTFIQHNSIKILVE